MAQPQAVAEEAGPYVILGRASRPEGRRPVVLPEGDRRSPLVMVGKTGMGKTSFMENLIYQDITAGRGVALFDVHGDMTMRLMSRIPPDRIEQVVIIDPSHAQSCVALNPLALADRLDPNVLVGELVGVFRQYFGELWSVGQMEDTWRVVLWALMSRPGLSLGDMGRLFHDVAFRQQLATAIVNPVVKEYWLQEFAQLSQAQQLERSRVLQNKVRAFLTNDSLRRILTAPSCLDLRRHLDNGGILFVRPVGLAEAEGNLLVGVVAALLFAAARSRADIPVERRRVCYLYLDEAQTLGSSSLPSILSQGRKSGLLCGGLALQYLEALEPAVRGAILGNAGTFVVFRCGPGDARLLQPALSPLTAADLENVDRYRAVCKMQRGGATLPPFGLEPPDPLALGTVERAAAVLAASRQRHGVTEQERPTEQQNGNNRDIARQDTWDTA
jgi:hypothetical protein